MPQLTQGLIVAVLIGLLLAIIVGYYLRQSQVNELSEAVRQSQQRQADLAQEHEQRLREATLQLQKDYEAQLSERMERYQAQYDEQRSQMEAEYEARLKEAATKIQQAYEQHLQEKLLEARSQAQQDYDQRLAAAIAHHQGQAQASPAQDTGLSLGALAPELAPAGATHSTDLAEVEARLQAQYNQQLAERLAEYQDDMAQRMTQMEQDYEARLQMAQASAPGADAIAADPSIDELELNLRRELEASLREEYEQKLAEKIEHYQDELTQRTQELEQSYEAQLRLLQSAPSDFPAPGADGVEFDLDSAIAAASAANLESGLDFEGSSMPPDTSAPLATEADLSDSGAESVSGSEFALDADSDAENLETSNLSLEEPFAAEPVAPAGEDSGLGFDAALLDSSLENAADGEFNSASGFDLETFESTSLEPDLDLEGTFFSPEAAQPDADLGFDAAFLDSDLENAQGNEFDLNPESAPDTEPAVSPGASVDGGLDDFLASDLETAQGDEFGLDPNSDAATFDADSLDLDALLNASSPDNSSDDLLTGLDDISDLS